MKILQAIGSFFRVLFSVKTEQQPLRKKATRLVQFHQVIIKPSREAPDALLQSGTLLIVRDGTFDRWVRFMCPCGCGQKRSISLQASHHPHWSLREDRGTVTLYPSVHVNSQDGCGAHFFVRKNKIDWV